MRSLLLKLKDYAEGTIQTEEWEQCWEQHQEELESLLSRRAYLLLKKRPLLAAQELLPEHHIGFVQKRFSCAKCGRVMFRIIGGETTADELVDFVTRCSPNFGGREFILKWRWMMPGWYCPAGCTSMRDSTPYTPSAEELIWRDEYEKNSEEWHRLDMEERARTPWGETVCPNCGKRLSTWADSSYKRCGYCRHPLEIPPDS